MAEDRSEAVVEQYKQHKLSRSAWHRIRDLLQEFEQARVTDKRIAIIGLSLVVLLLGAAWLYLGDSNSIIIR